VVIDLVAASVNGADWKMRSGQCRQVTFPLVLGRDFSGVVGAFGAGVTDFGMRAIRSSRVLLPWAARRDPWC